MLQKIIDTLQDRREESLGRLIELLKIPSVSTDPAYATHCREAADWLADQLEHCGMDAKVETTAGHPAVIAKNKIPVDGAPHILFYGHYDVQPADPLELWNTPPFEPTICDGKIFARGACDDKGQVMTFIEALRAYYDVAGHVPINLTVLLEGDEERGSVAMEQFVAENREQLQADVALVSDTAMWDKNTPSIIYALRGLLYFDVKLFGPSRDLHSGVYGGTVANPATELALVLGQLMDDQHAVTIDGFYDDVIELTDEEKQAWQKLPFTDEKWAGDIGLTELHGEQGFSTLERRWARPSCDINGLYGGYSGEGAKTVIPAMAGAKISFRIVANQDPEKIAESFVKWFKDRTPPGCKWEFEQHGVAYPVCLSTESPWINMAKQAILEGTGMEPVLVREGATIPVVSTFKEVLGLDSLLIGFGLNDDNLHAPNEKFDLTSFDMGCKTHVALLHRFGQ